MIDLDLRDLVTDFQQRTRKLTGDKPTMSDIAASAGISTGYLFMLIKGERSASDDCIQRLATALDTTVDKVIEALG